MASNKILAKLEERQQLFRCSITCIVYVTSPTTLYTSYLYIYSNDNILATDNDNILAIDNNDDILAIDNDNILAIDYKVLVLRIAGYQWGSVNPPISP